MLDYVEDLLPNLIDAQASLDPNKLYGAFSRSPVSEEDVEKVSYLRMSNAVNRLAWFLQEKFGRSTTTYETLAYVGPADMRYPMFALAAAKTGHQVSYHYENLKFCH